MGYKYVMQQISLADALHCHNCKADIDWRFINPENERLYCPRCGYRRWIHTAGKETRIAVGNRDNWQCWRCHMPIDWNVEWPHPLAGVADHYPVPKLIGGPTVMGNLRIAHSLCNGSSYLYERSLTGRATIPDHRYDTDNEIKEVSSNPIIINDDQQRMVDAILSLAGEQGTPFMMSYKLPSLYEIIVKIGIPNGYIFGDLNRIDPEYLEPCDSPINEKYDRCGKLDALCPDGYCRKCCGGHNFGRCGNCNEFRLLSCDEPECQECREQEIDDYDPYEDETYERIINGVGI
jgi:DNA-directed RNA polymerase subunit RPC12/RpoP